MLGKLEHPSILAQRQTICIRLGDLENRDNGEITQLLVSQNAEVRAKIQQILTISKEEVKGVVDEIEKNKLKGIQEALEYLESNFRS